MKSSRARRVLALVVVWLALIVLHYPWRCLPYYWDEAGYYALAAMDFYRSGLLIPESTQKLGHTPLVTAFVGATWRVLGPSPCWAREAMMLVAAATLVATYALGCRVAGRQAAAWAAALLALSPLFFAQSSMLHIETAPALFVTLAVLALLPRPQCSDLPAMRMASFALAASLAILSKETAVILLPVAWGYAWRVRRERRATAWLALGFPLLPLVAWAVYYHHATGYWTGNSEYLRYNLYSTLSPLRFLLTLARRVYQLLIAGFDWMLVVGALLGIWWERRAQRAGVQRPVIPNQSAGSVWQKLMGELAGPEAGAPSAEQPARPSGDLLFLAGGLCAAYCTFHSLVGGAVLRRYLLPTFPVFYVGAVAFVWELPKRFAQSFCALTAAYFIAAWFLNPPYPFAFEDNLAYADFVRLHQQAARYLESHNAEARILTAWPATGELTTPFLGYVSKPLRVVPVEGFTAAELSGVAPDSFDLLYLYSRKWEPANNWLARFPFLERLQGRCFGYAPQVRDQVLEARYGLKLAAEYERRGQWVRVYSK
jgi:4-amino-4-deoxy-L-arabinose transferase-like glycosyltransferase